MNKIRLLLIDDDDEFRESMGTALDHRSFDVTLADGGKEALRLLDGGSFDIAVLDLKMPDLGGLETLGRVRTKGNRIPVMILTGHGGVDDAMAGIDLGIIDFIHKPVSPEILTDRIVTLLRTQQVLRERETEEALTPTGRFGMVHGDEPLAKAVELICGITDPEPGEGTGAGVGELVLVYDRDNRFLGILTARDIIEMLSPFPERYAEYASYLTGMFLGQSLMLEKQTAADALNDVPPLEVKVPLMEAVHTLLCSGRTALPVFRKGTLAGVLRERDVMAEIHRILSRAEP